MLSSISFMVCSPLVILPQLEQSEFQSTKARHNPLVSRRFRRERCAGKLQATNQSAQRVSLLSTAWTIQLATRAMMRTTIAIAKTFDASNWLPYL